MIPSVPLIPPPALILDLGEGGRLPFQAIHADTFVMGARGYDPAEEPPHPVTIARAFFLGTTPVTQEQFARRFPDHRNHFSGEANLPAENLTWHEAVEFCDWLQATCAGGIPAGFRAALPDEARWEFACRAGSRTEYAKGDGAAVLAEMGWYGDNSGKRTHPVAGKQPNAWGLYDCHGNVQEWMSDTWNPDAYRDDPAQAAASAAAVDAADPHRVVRGGSWVSSAGFCRSALRFGDGPGVRLPNLGFRVCLVPGPDSPTSPDRRGDQAAPRGVPRDEAEGGAS